MIRRCNQFMISLFLLMLISLLTACEDREAAQRKAFTDFLQNTVLRGGEQVPTLSEDQRRKFGRYVEDYAILVNFSQQMKKVTDTGLVPLITLIEQIRTPEDYVRQHELLQRSLGTFNLLGQQIQSDKMRADHALSTLQQSDDLKLVYGQVYNKIVTQPANALLPLIPQLSSLTQSIIQVGEFLTAQGTQVSYANGGVQFKSEQAVAQYNALMDNLKTQQQVIPIIKNNLLYRAQ